MHQVCPANGHVGAFQDIQLHGEVEEVHILDAGGGLHLDKIELVFALANQDVCAHGNVVVCERRLV